MILGDIMLPIEFLNSIKNVLNENEYEEFIKSYEKKALRALRINTLKADTKSFINENPFNIKGCDRVSWCEDGFYFDDDAVGKHPWHNAGIYYIQDASAMAPVMELDVKEGDYVLDLCASPGGKSTQIAAKLNNSGILISNEISVQRAKNLSENIERMGIANVLVISHSADQISDRFSGFFNKILVDAPCSGEGMFRKNEEAVNEWSPENVIMCAKRQQEILEEADKMLCYGGLLVYSTCTFNEKEDEGTINTFLENHKEYELIKEYKLWPHKIKGEGHFVAVLNKGNAESINSKPLGGYLTPANEKELKEFREFEKESLKIKIDDIYGKNRTSYFYFGEELYAAPEFFPNLKGLKVLRPGLHLGTLKKNRFEPSHSLALFLKSDDAVNVTQVDEYTARSYISGQTFNVDGNKGYHLICIDGYSLGWGKLSQGIMKNHYPKGLRKS